MTAPSIMGRALAAATTCSRGMHLVAQVQNYSPMLNKSVGFGLVFDIRSSSSFFNKPLNQSFSYTIDPTIDGAKVGNFDLGNDVAFLDVNTVSLLYIPSPIAGAGLPGLILASA